MKITKRKLRRIIREEKELLLKEAIKFPWGETDSAYPDDNAVLPPTRKIEFKWGPGGLEMEMRMNGEKILGFTRQSQVDDLIEQLEGLLAGPMRTSP